MTDLLAVLREGLASAPTANRPAGIEIVQRLAPAGGLNVKPPSYEGDLEIHPRSIDGEVHQVIELDSVGSAANRIEEALAELDRAGDYPLPVARTTVDPGHGLEPIEITTLEAPHRVFDAWIRLSENADGQKFEDTQQGHDLTLAHPRKLDALLETSAHDLLLGVWDSHRKGPHGQIRLARSLTTSLIGLLPDDDRESSVVAALVGNAKPGEGHKALHSPFVQQPIAARRDPLNLGQASDLPKGEQKLSAQGLSSIPPVRTKQTVSITEARYLGYLSFPALRRLGFETYDETEVRVLLALLALYGLLLRDDQGWDLRSGATFVPTTALSFRIARAAGKPEEFVLDVVEVRRLLDQAVARVGIKDRKITLQAGKTLDGLVQRSIADAKKKEQ